MMTTLFILLWLLPIAGNIYLDRSGRKPNYLVMFILRGMAAILHGILFNPHNLYDYAPIFIFQITSFWIFFELGLNLIRGKHWLYYDHSEGDSGIIDRFFMWAGEKAHGIAKVLCFIVMVLSIAVIYTRH